ncbi:TonB-dependent receptor [Haliea sp. E1-2-M8]|uniref:TonB-dependent receptor n=1 Tax=Haliea sp. E1-2-M8 TaxID=3064706 RepID=UPI002723AD7F|nr:TonB-dependent receptor [Haliea sp. E1-2-M8]MDO8861995.1 TonB-dependent receptor [Haliea sp. E1-2-M8]
MILSRAIKKALNASLSAGMMTMPLAAGALAQSQDEGKRTLEEIVVTATKRATSLQDTPMSISAFDASYLDANNVNEFSEFADSIPNVSAPDGLNGAGNSISIRGISSQTRGGSSVEQPAGAYLDQVFVGAEGFLDYVIYDIAQIEVLRGPQGTVWGRNTASGAISYRSQRPTREFGGYVDVQAGDYDLSAFEGAVSGPLAGDKLLFRVAGMHYERDGYIDDLDGGSFGTQDQDAVRAQLHFLPTDELDILLIGQYLESEGVDNIPTWSAGPGYEGPPELNVGSVHGKRVGRTNGPSNVTSELFGLTSIVTWNLADYELTSVTGYQSAESSAHIDDEGSGLDLAEAIYGLTAYGIDHDPDASDIFSQELRLVSPRLWNTTEFTLGLYYFDREFDTERSVKVGSYIVDTLGLQLPFGASALLERERVASSTESYAAFGQGSFDITPRLALQAGFRITEETKDFAFANGAVFLGENDETLLDIPLGEPLKLDQFEDTVFTGMLGLKYHVSDDVMVYATYSEGYKSGGFNRSFVTAPDLLLPFFGPEEVANHELGLRSKWLDGRLTVNATAFFMSYDDLQVEGRVINEQGQIVSQIENAGQAESQGLELEVTALPAPDWELFFSAGYLDAEFTRFVNVDGADYSGNSLPFAPDLNLSLRSRHDFDLGAAGTWYVQGEWVHQGSYYSEPSNRERGSQGSSNMFHARAAWISANGNWELGVWGRNLSDEDLLVDYNPAVEDNVTLFHGATLRSWSAPRTAGVDLKYSF